MGSGKTRGVLLERRLSSQDHQQIGAEVEVTWECDLDDGPKVYSWTEPIAQKEYVCCECKRKILRGQRYFKAEGLWDGQWSTFRQHLICLQACMYVRDNMNGGDCIAFGGLMDYYGDSKDWIVRNKNRPEVKVFRGLMAKVLKLRRV